MTIPNNHGDRDPGQQRRELIVGGHGIDPPDRYPYFVSIDKNNGVIVNGVLIAPDIVLSAGHIALNFMNNLTLKVGPYAVHNDEPTAETISVQEWLVPNQWSEFQEGFFANDYMILKLQSPSSHAPIRINRNPARPSHEEPVIMIGLGWTNATHMSPASIVQEVELLAVSNQQCAEAKDPSRGISFAGKIQESMLCTASPPNTTRDGCAWDSGAPVILKGNTPDEDVLVGLGSTGVGCADAIFPAIQARVACPFGLWWIRQHVCRLSANPPADFQCAAVPDIAANLNSSATTSETTDVAPQIVSTAPLGPASLVRATPRFSTSIGSNDGASFPCTTSLLLMACAALVLVSTIGRRFYHHVVHPKCNARQTLKTRGTEGTNLCDPPSKPIVEYGAITLHC